ncbi:DUF58 domain-containing protein [Methylocystis sp. B8]|uniref:DUF58 domain-containing protein n=1 Tax=Methylocystis sp. B8 TaxID=544938 RepID=UPI0010FD4C53|nr:DUF58 domain-containing protein [Methylocystis sp. B8]TLG77839.1 DUF58 domain-containing protein [Methylocystis sp. B8]
MNSVVDILYRPRGRFVSNHVGAHTSSEVGGFGVFRDQAPFIRYPDARRIDVRATLRDPFGGTYVRRFEQRAAIDVYALVDLSASMGFVGAVDRFRVAVDLCAALAYSTTRVGDRFGLFAFERNLIDRATLPATRSRKAALGAVERLALETPRGSSAKGVLGAAAALGATRKLVFLISDVRWPESLIEQAFDALALHDVAPLVLIDSVETAPPKWGLMELRDSESGRRELLLMRPALQRRWIEAEQARRRSLARLSSLRGRAPIYVKDSFDPIDLSIRLTAA